MAVEYARHGLVGLLTPQANTTAEPEAHILFPAGVGVINARLVSSAADMNDRLVAYFDTLDATIAQFANAPVGAYAMACTGASYLVGLARENAIVAAPRRAPLITAGHAVADAFGVLGARRVALVSPYPPDLTAASVSYWQAHGFAVARVIEVAAEGAAFHPIYAMPAASADAALGALETGEAVDAVVMLGTGMPTLGPIRARPFVQGAPVISCMLALCWRATAAVGHIRADRESLLAWVGGGHWRDANCFDIAT
jgi:maleate cis-trans isomerase